MELLHNGDLVSASTDKTIKIWDIKEGTVKRTLTGHTDRIFALKALGEDLVSGSWDCTIKVWNIEDGTIKKSFKFDSYVNTIEVFQNSDLVVGCKNGKIKILN